MTRKKTIKIPIYYGDLILIQTDDTHSVLDKYDQTIENPDISYPASMFADYSSGGYTKYIVVFDDTEMTPRDIAHESLHLVNTIFKDRGIWLDPNNDEPWCYFLGWVVDQLTRFLDKG